MVRYLRTNCIWCHVFCATNKCFECFFALVLFQFWTVKCLWHAVWCVTLTARSVTFWGGVMVAAVACVFHSIPFGWILFVCLAVKHYHHRHRNHYYCYYLCCCCCFVAKGHKHTLNCFKLQTIHSKLRMNRCEKESVEKNFVRFVWFFFLTSLLLFSIWYLTCCTLAMSTSFSQRACLTLWNALSRLKKSKETFEYR